MEEAAAAHPGGMMAVLGGEEDVGPRPRRTASALTVANDNAPGQLVLSGAAEALDRGPRAAARRRRQGDPAAGRRRLPLAADGRAPASASAPPSTTSTSPRPQLPVFSSTAAEPFADPRAGLAAALTEPVLWQATLKRMRAAGAARFLETGPGDVLTGLVRRTLDGVEARSLAEPEAVHA